MSHILGNGNQLRGMTRTDSVGQVLEEPSLSLCLCGGVGVTNGGGARCARVRVWSWCHVGALEDQRGLSG